LTITEIKEAEERIRRSYDDELQQLKQAAESQAKEKEELQAQLLRLQSTPKDHQRPFFSPHPQDDHGPFGAKVQKPSLADENNPFASASKPAVAQAYDPFASPATQQMQESTNYKEAYLSQSSELSRLTLEFTRLSKELTQKEEQCAQLVSEKARSDGGSAGLRDALANFKEDMIKLQGEYDSKLQEAAELLRRNKELHNDNESLRESLRNEKSFVENLQSQLQAEQFRNQHTSATSSSSNSNLKTPAKRTPGKLGPSTPPTNRLGASPATREAARLYADIAQERRRLHALQEEHADLLGLLAQQEVELKVFRSSLEALGGESSIDSANDEARRTAIELYGTYVSFRGAGDVEEDDDEDDNGDGFVGGADVSTGPWRD